MIRERNLFVCHGRPCADALAVIYSKRRMQNLHQFFLGFLPGCTRPHRFVRHIPECIPEWWCKALELHDTIFLQIRICSVVERWDPLFWLAESQIWTRAVQLS